MPISIIQECCKEAATNDTFWVAIISGGSAVLGAAVVALANFLSSRSASQVQHKLESKKLHVSMVTTERLRWLQDLRARLSALYAQLDTQFDLLRRPVLQNQQAQRQTELDALSLRVMLETNHIILMLNPAKPNQAKLRNSLNSALTVVLASFAPGAHAHNSAQYAKLKNDCFDALTSIGVTAWQKIQNLE